MKEKIHVIIEWLEAVLIAVVIAVVIENLLFSFAVVNGQSMAPTLDSEDRLLIGKAPFIYHRLNIGDLVIFNPPDQSNQDEIFIKRVIAKESDHFYIEDGILYINGERKVENYIFEEDYLKRNYQLLEGVVPPDTVFVMGDNRNDSNDSRTFGFVPKDKIKGKVLFKVWPLDEVKAFISSK